MSRKHYTRLATMMGDGLAIAQLAGGEPARTEFYNEVYTPLVVMLAEDNPRYDAVRFAYAASQAEASYMQGAKEAGR